MSLTVNGRNQEDNLTIQDYLNASGDASSRTRNITLALVVACVLTFIALLNSLQNSWMLKRLQQLRQPSSEYLIQYVGTAPNREDYRKKEHERYLQALLQYQTANAANNNTLSNVDSLPDSGSYEKRADADFDQDREMYQTRYHAFLVNTSRALVDTRFLVRVPFFGITFDINDLGMLAGIGLTTLLGLFRLSISNELENLKLSFRHASKMGKLAEFYRLLAMKQVLTSPDLPDRKISRFHRHTPKLIYFLPLVVYLCVVLNDLYTNRIGFALDNLRTLLLLASDIVFLFIVLILSIIAFQRTRDVDGRWARAWCDYMAEEFKDTRDGEWLRRLNRAVDQGQFSPEQLVASLPEADEKRGKCHVYRSDDRWLLIIDLDAGTANIKPAESVKGQGI
jgi:hypothetical protein